MRRRELLAHSAAASVLAFVGCRSSGDPEDAAPGSTDRQADPSTTPATFLSQYDALQSDELRMVLLGTWLRTRVDELTRELRTHRPVLQAPMFTLVSRDRDVREVLAAHEVFAVPYRSSIDRLLGGPFVLGMEDSPDYRRDLSVLREAMPPSDLPRIEAIVTAAADEAVDRASEAGTMDVVGQLAGRVPMRLLERYFGVPGPDGATLRRWVRSLFWEIFINLGRDPQVSAQADADAARMRAYLDQLIADRRAQLDGGAGEFAGEDVLTRLLRMQSRPDLELGDADVRRHISGLVIGAVDPTCTATVYALDELLRRPDALAGARRAAQESDQQLRRYVLEAMRFKPHTDVLVRVCARPFVLGRGTEYEVEVAPKTPVLVSTRSAMHDADAVPEPDAFRPERAGELLHFGHGVHACLGRSINTVQIATICRSLLRRSGLRRASGEAGVLSHEGPFPSSLRVEFEPG